jgi:dGTPase
LPASGERFAAFTVRCLIDLMVRDVIRTSAAAIGQAAPEKAESVYCLPAKLIGFSPEFQKMTDDLRKFLFHNLYFNPALDKLNDMSFRNMRKLFSFYVDNPLEMGENARRRIVKTGVEQAAADYIAGMTDRFASREYRRISRMDPEG